jgi:hypothetical protein
MNVLQRADTHNAPRAPDSMSLDTARENAWHFRILSSHGDG